MIYIDHLMHEIHVLELRIETNVQGLHIFFHYLSSSLKVWQNFQAFLAIKYVRSA